MIDINKTLDLVKLKFFNEWIYTIMSSDATSELHKELTNKSIEMHIDPLMIPKNAAILDIGCGQGYFMDNMKEKGYTNMLGITLNDKDAEICKTKGHTVKNYDMTFLPQKDGFNDETIDFVFMRQILQCSPYPIFTLVEYNRLLKLGGKMYIEVPAPDAVRKHEFNTEHYSVMGAQQLAALLDRTGFRIDKFNDMKFDLSAKDPNGGDDTIIPEVYYTIVVTKTRPIDIK
jgi:ubiquinone/menaquinone biosynthesis C-methylase UbiE